MLDFQNIAGAIPGLSHEDKLKLRSLLDAELSVQKAPTVSNAKTKRSSNLIGLFADEPELMDRVMETVYERRSRPLRITE